MGPKDIAAWRMNNLRLVGPPLGDPATVVRWLGAVQSQDFGPAKWSVAARTPGATDADLDEAFNAGRILRTHVLRPTWHFVLPEDIRLFLQVTGPRVKAGSRGRWRELGLDGALLERCLEIFSEVLRGGAHRTRLELADTLADEGINTDGQRLAHIVMHAELEGAICSGPMKGKQHTYALLEERAPTVPTLSDDEALAVFTRRYFTSHGPATAKDFQSWSSLTLTQIRRAIAMIGTLQSMDIDGLTYWYADEPSRPWSADPPGHLLQMYDEYIMGYRETRNVLDAARAGRVPAMRPSFNGMAVVNTQVVGEWKRTITKDAVAVKVARRRPLSAKDERELHRAADRYGNFLGRRAAVSFTDSPGH